VLRELRLSNLAIAADVTVTLGPGLNVLTGSTGAGKSLVVEALRWLTGDPIERGLIRAGAAAASAEAFFDLEGRPDLLDALEELGLPRPRDGCLRVRREVRVGGRSRAHIDATPAPAALLAALCGRLIELQSQHEQVRLLQPSAHAALLDGCGVADELLREHEAAFDDHALARAAVEQWQARRAQLLAQRDLVEVQLRDLERARLRDGELEALRQTVARMAGGARLVEAVSAASEALADEDRGAAHRLAEAQRLLSRAGTDLDALAQAREALVSAAELAAQAQRVLAGFLADSDLDPAELDRSQARLAELQALVRRYGRSERELIELRERLRLELAGLDDGPQPPPALALGLAAATQRLQAAAVALHRARVAVARTAQRVAEALLAELGMREAQLAFALTLRESEEGPVRIDGRAVQPAREGPERVALLVRTNRGEALGPVERVASGGELSRLSLVLRTLSARRHQPALLILDEVDTGLSADLGPAVAERLRAMAAEVQLLVITHMPAVAAAAQRHLAARKEAEGDRVISQIAVLQAGQRVAELARMLGGEGEQQRKLARHMLRAQAGEAATEAAS
jgi:DNA repair protein RecN (Recombination protein N)